MRIVCQTPSEFIECLMTEDTVFQNTVRISVVYEHSNEARILVTLKSTALVDVEDEAQYLLVLGYHCGFDYRDGKMEKQGSNEAALVKKDIRNCCDEKGWKVLPGAIEE